MTAAAEGRIHLMRVPAALLHAATVAAADCNAAQPQHDALVSAAERSVTGWAAGAAGWPCAVDRSVLRPSLTRSGS